MKIAETHDDFVEWNHLDPNQARLGIVTKRSNHPLIEKLKTKLPKETIFFHIKNDITGEYQSDGISITEFETLPSADTNSEFGIQRMNWVQKYLELLCFMHERERQEFIPTGGFKPHIEGPLCGYIKAINNLSESEDKKLLQTHLEKLEHVKWGRSETEGFTYKISGDSPEELLESVYLAAWSFWTFAISVQRPNPLVVILELEDNLLIHPVLDKKRELIDFIVRSLSQLTFDYLVTFVVKSPNLYPIPESNVEFLLVENLDAKDIDFNDALGFNVELQENEIIVISQGVYKIMKLSLDSPIEL